MERWLCSYERRRPDDTLLYQLIEEHWPTFRERAERSGGLPDFIVEEFEAYLRCGMLEHGLAHFACRQCGESLAVAHSCKKRGFCPTCTGRGRARSSVGGH
ncbi:transposase zinc-binding domain-containing protein [Enhygromyxa salina]|uniref:transposase zinc-binding domain-containing protein n=1 Tax=Enhygromyxa salina TaxID=215803 RepID=UPI0013FCFDDC|nr:transposase zinc-binding domain-containing protein [Enhygromyxa salina]